MHEYMVTMDRPQHDDYRGLMKRLFTPRRLAENEDFMWRLADEQMNPFIATGEVEFSNAYSSPFAGLVIADLLGVPDEDMPRFREYFAAQLEDVGDNTTAMVEDPLAFFQDSFAGYIEERRQQPRADVLTHLAEATFADGSQPDVDTLARESAFVFAAGQETTVRLLTFSLRYLAEHPEVAGPASAPARAHPTFVEEMLRLESPIKAHFRMARRTTTVGGVRIAAGMTVMLVNGAANRDPRHFEASDRGPARPGERPGPAGVQPRRPRLPGSVAGPGRGTGDPRAGPRPDGRHPHLRGCPRSRRCPPLGVPTDLALPRTHRAAPGVHPHRRLSTATRSCPRQGRGHDQRGKDRFRRWYDHAAT